MRLYLVRHGLPVIEPELLPSTWELDPAHFDDIWALRESARLPTDATWFCSPESKAVSTAQLLTEREVGVVEGLREQVRDSADWIDDMEAVVRRAFAEPARSAHPGWEPLERTRERVLTAVHALVDAHREEDLVLVGHATAWTVLAAALTGAEPDLDRWAELGMPDVIEVDLPVASS